jgi:hypothetical protein
VEGESMIQIMKIEPGEKYVMLFPKIKTAGRMTEIADSFEEFLTENTDTLAFIYGEGIAIVPAKQIVGYKVIGEDD